MKTALLIIDVQNFYFPNGSCELCQPTPTLYEVKKLLDYFRKQELPVYFIQHIWDLKSYPEGLSEEEAIHKDISPLGGEKVFLKERPNSFSNKDLQPELEKNQIDKLVICGMMTHMCVDTTVRAAKDVGYDITIISDACATKALEWKGRMLPADVVQDVYMASLENVFAEILTCEEYLASKI